MVLEFYPVDYDDDSVGFVAVEPEFEPWLIAAVGVTFEDISYAVLGEDERGVRYSKIGKNAGIQEGILGPGITWRIPFFTEIFVYPVCQQRFSLIHSYHDPRNPHRNALIIDLGPDIKHLNVEVCYELDPGALLNYARAYYSIPPKVVAEGELRYRAQIKPYTSLTEFVHEVNKHLAQTGIRLISVTPLDPAQKTRLQKR